MRRVRLRSTFVERRDHSSPYCYWCDVELESEAILSNRTMDHYIPRAQGGSDHHGNLVPACGFCNWTRGTINPSLWDQIAREIIQPYRHDMQTIIELLNERDHEMAKRAYGNVLRHTGIVAREYALADIPQEFDDTLTLVHPRPQTLEKWAAAADQARPLIHKNKGVGVSIGQDVIVHSQMVRCLHIPGGFSILSKEEYRTLRKHLDTATEQNQRFLMETPGFLRWETFSMREHAVGVLHYETDTTPDVRMQKAWVFANGPAASRAILKTIEIHKLVSLVPWHPHQYVPLLTWDLKDNHA